MRKTMGRYIDTLDDAGRVALMTAPKMNDGLEWWSDGCGCLVGTVVETFEQLLQTREWRDNVWVPHQPQGRFGVRWDVAPASARYPHAVMRFGLDRVVRAVKARAAAPNRSARIAACTHISIPKAPLETAEALR